METVSHWTPADLRRFVVNKILTDPGAFPKTASASSSSSPDVPIGGMIDYGGSGDPSDSSWLLCDGRAIKRSEYGPLYSVIGTTYGSGDGSTTFNLPDFRGRTAVGPDNMGTSQGAASRVTSSNTMGATGGEQSHLLTAAESGLKDHTHYSSGGTGASAANTTDTVARHAGGADYSLFTNVVNGVVGSNQNASSAHNNMQPYQVANKIIRVK